LGGSWLFPEDTEEDLICVISINFRKIVSGIDSSDSAEKNESTDSAGSDSSLWMKNQGERPWQVIQRWQLAISRIGHPDGMSAKLFSRGTQG
jgi:hypothetical protein